ncbi:MAG: rhodanese-like domain-containing protein [Xanthomonadales bacterium]|nr:rhodanese-like domain-containing protein [Xanthomonadales bacterium]
MNPSRFFVVSFSLVLTTLVCITAASANEKPAESEPSKDKQTILERQVTAEEAYEKWRAAPDSVRVLDVRTLEEYLFVGHAPMSRNIPLYYQTDQWDAKKERFAMVPNLDFVYQVKQAASVDETILVICRSGGRGAKATNMLANAGFKNVFNIEHGMEGDKISDPQSAYQGQRLRNGWKNSGLPWTYKVDPERMPVTASENTDTEVEKE